MNEFDSNNLNDKVPEPEPEIESAGDGGNRRRRTSVGTGGNSGWDGDGSPPGGGDSDEDPDELFGEPVRHGHLKDIAIDVLKESHSKDYSDVRDRLLRKLHLRFGEAHDTREAMADILSSMVVSAYTVASFMPGPRSTSELKAVFPYFSAQQIKRISSMA